MIPVNGENNFYGGDFTASAGLIYQKDAGVLTAIGLVSRLLAPDVRTMYQGDLIVGRLAMGAGT